MPKRPKTPPPNDDEPKYLAVVHPYPSHANMELLTDRQTFIFWIACICGKDDLYAVFHKPSAPGTVIIEVARHFQGFHKLLGAHKWSDFLRKPHAAEKEKVSKIYYSTFASGRAVEKAGWKRKNVEESWFTKWSPKNAIIKFPYPQSSWCEIPQEDITDLSTIKLCRPIPRDYIILPPPPPRPPPVGSAQWVKAMASQPPPGLGPKKPKPTMKTIPIESTRQFLAPPTISPTISRPPSVAWHRSPSVAASTSSQSSVPFSPVGEYRSLPWDQRDDQAHSVSDNYSVSNDPSISDRSPNPSWWPITTSSSSSSIPSSDSPGTPGEAYTSPNHSAFQKPSIPIHIPTPSPSYLPSIVDIQALEYQVEDSIEYPPDTETYDWNADTAPVYSSKPDLDSDTPPTCPEHGPICPRGICSVYGKLKKEWEKRQERKAKARVVNDKTKGRWDSKAKKVERVVESLKPFADEVASFHDERNKEPESVRPPSPNTWRTERDPIAPPEDDGFEPFVSKGKKKRGKAFNTRAPAQKANPSSRDTDDSTFIQPHANDRDQSFELEAPGKDEPHNPHLNDSSSSKWDAIASEWETPAQVEGGTTETYGWGDDHTGGWDDAGASRAEADSFAHSVSGHDQNANGGTDDVAPYSWGGPADDAKASFRSSSSAPKSNKKNAWGRESTRRQDPGSDSTPKAAWRNDNSRGWKGAPESKSSNSWQKAAAKPSNNSTWQKATNSKKVHAPEKKGWSSESRPQTNPEPTSNASWTEGWGQSEDWGTGTVSSGENGWGDSEPLSPTLLGPVIEAPAWDDVEDAVRISISAEDGVERSTSLDADQVHTSETGPLSWADDVPESMWKAPKEPDHWKTSSPSGKQDAWSTASSKSKSRKSNNPGSSFPSQSWNAAHVKSLKGAESVGGAWKNQSNKSRKGGKPQNPTNLSGWGAREAPSRSADEDIENAIAALDEDPMGAIFAAVSQASNKSRAQTVEPYW